MKLYHGSNVEVNEPRIIQPVRNLDFGAGFYTTSDLEQAKRWAKSTTKRRKNGNAIVSVFEIVDSDIKILKIKEFKNASIDWLELVAKNRKNPIFDNEYDVIIGPVANDNTMPVIDLYMQGFINETEAIERLLTQKLKDQVVFKNNESLSKLKFIQRIDVK